MEPYQRRNQHFRELFANPDLLWMGQNTNHLATPPKVKQAMTADVDLERQEWLRNEDEKIEMPKKYRVAPGTLRWRRPDLYGALASEGDLSLDGP